MPNHNDSHFGSKSVCDSLFNHIKSKMPELEKSESKEVCSFFHRKKNVFAFIYHAKTRPNIKAYFLGDVAIQPTTADESIKIQSRPKIEENWPKAFPYFMMLDDTSNISNAAEILIRYAYPLSDKKRRRNKENLTESIFPEMEITEELSSNVELLFEGSKRLIYTNVYERNVRVFRLSWNWTVSPL